MVIYVRVHDCIVFFFFLNQWNEYMVGWVRDTNDMFFLLTFEINGM